MLAWAFPLPPHGRVPFILALLGILAVELLVLSVREDAMETLVLGGTLLGSLAGAFLIQKVALEGLFRIMRAGRRTRR